MAHECFGQVGVLALDALLRALPSLSVFLRSAPFMGHGNTMHATSMKLDVRPAGSCPLQSWLRGLLCRFLACQQQVMQHAHVKSVGTSAECHACDRVVTEGSGQNCQPVNMTLSDGHVWLRRLKYRRCSAL